MNERGSPSARSSLSSPGLAADARRSSGRSDPEATPQPTHWSWPTTTATLAGPLRRAFRRQAERRPTAGSRSGSSRSGAWGGENRVIDDVAAGEADLGWAGTRAFDTLGVDAFRPLHAPFLVNSYAAEAALVQSQPVQERRARPAAPRAGRSRGLLSTSCGCRPAPGGRCSIPRLHGLLFGLMPSEVQTAALSALGARSSRRGRSSPRTSTAWSAETMWPTYLNNARRAIPLRDPQRGAVAPATAIWPTPKLWPGSTRRAWGGH